MGRLAHQNHVDDWRWNMLIPQLCDGVWRWVMQFAVDLQLLREVPMVEWSAPALPMIDRTRRGKRSSARCAAAPRRLPAPSARGVDPETHFAEIADTNATLDELGIVLDSDPRKTSGTGQAQGADPAPDSENDVDAGDESLRRSFADAHHIGE